MPNRPRSKAYDSRSIIGMWLTLNAWAASGRAAYRIINVREHTHTHTRTHGQTDQCIWIQSPPHTYARTDGNLLWYSISPPPSSPGRSLVPRHANYRSPAMHPQMPSDDDEPSLLDKFSYSLSLDDLIADMYSVHSWSYTTTTFHPGVVRNNVCPSMTHHSLVLVIPNRYVLMLSFLPGTLCLHHHCHNFT